MNKFPKKELTRYYHLIGICENLIQTVENRYKNDRRWFMFSLKTATKFLTHCKSLCLLSADTFFNESENTQDENEFFDLQGIFGNLRIQMDCYSTLYHIFFEGVDKEMKRLRFDLWRYDSEYEKRKLNNERGDDYMEYLGELEELIITNSYYRSLTDNQRAVVFTPKKAHWKFFPHRLTKKNSIVRWKELFAKTGVKEELFSKVYASLSMYVHSNFHSVAHHVTLSKDHNYEGKRFAILFSSFLICFVIDDLVSAFIEAENFVKKLEQRDVDIIKSFLFSGREKVNSKVFI